jgi:hypothetical protein
VREESHLDEMRSAIRGDFERLAKRRGDQELLRVGEEQPDAPGDEQASVAAPAAPEPDVRREPEPEVEAPPRRSWLSRFLSP